MASGQAADRDRCWLGEGAKCREEEWRLLATLCCGFRAFFFSSGRGFLGFLGFGLVVELVGCGRCVTLILVIGLIVHTVSDMLPRDG